MENRTGTLSHHTVHDFSRRTFLCAAFDWFPLLWWIRGRRLTLAGIRFQVIRRGRSLRRYVLIHGDEQTARQVLQAHMKASAGIAYLVTSQQRNVRLGNGWVDPNRIFSREGAARNLKLLNPKWSEEAIRAQLDRLDRDRTHLERALLPPPGGLLVALHNNSRGYSVRDELPISDASALNEPASPHEFFLATSPEDYQILARSPYNNAVLQKQAKGADDGSLSRLAAKRNLRYVNIEAGLGQCRKQQQMLEWLERNLP